MNRGVEAFKNGKRDGAKRLDEPALECVNPEKEPPALKRFIGLDSALYLKEVLDRVEVPPEQEIPDAKTAQTEHISRWTVPHTEITIALSEHKSSTGQFLFTEETVINSGKFYHKVREFAQ